MFFSLRRFKFIQFGFFGRWHYSFVGRPLSFFISSLVGNSRFIYVPLFFLKIHINLPHHHHSSLITKRPLSLRM